jgi:hypothetical protein
MCFREWLRNHRWYSIMEAASSELSNLVANLFNVYFDSNALQVLADWFEEHDDITFANYIRIVLQLTSSEAWERQTLTQELNVSSTQVTANLEKHITLPRNGTGITNSVIVGPHPRTNKSRVRYRLAGNQVEVRFTGPLRWETIPIQSIDENVVKGLLFIRLREFPIRYGDKLNHISYVVARSIRICLHDLTVCYERLQGEVGEEESPNRSRLQGVLRDIETLVVRIEYYLKQNPQGFSEEDRNVATWLYGSWHNPQAQDRGLPGFVEHFNEALAERLGNVLYNLMELMP